MPWFRSLLAALVCTGMASAADWPQWLGPNRDGATPETVAAWKEAPKVIWRQPVGEGHSSPVVAGGKVFVFAKVKDKDAEELIAFDARTGKEEWRTIYDRGAFMGLFGNGPRSTPAVDGGRVYTFGATGYLTCFETGGKQVWQVKTLEEFKAPNLKFGVSCSPLVEGDRVLVAVGGRGASVVAFDKAKGTVVWKGLDDGATYSSPIVFGKGGERQVVFLTAEGLVGLKPDDGTTFWRSALKDKLFESSTTPVRVGDLLVGSSVTFGSVGLKLGTKDGKPLVTEDWMNKALTCYFSTPVPVGDGLLFVVTGGLAPGTAALHCVDAKTGKASWTKEKIGQYHASLLRTGDDKLLMLDDAGNLMLLDPNKKEYTELAKAKVCGATWAHPALADGMLYVRDNKEVICVALPAK